MLDPDVIINVADDPSLDDAIADLLAELRSEQRFFGPTARRNPKPAPSLINGLAQTDGFRFVAVGRDRVVGVVRVDTAGDVLVAVTRGRRSHGIGTALLRAAMDHAIREQWGRLVLRTSHRSDAAMRAAAHVGAVAVDVGRGRVDMILPVGIGAVQTPA